MDPGPANRNLPLADWRRDLEAAIEDIQQLGLEIVRTHSEASLLAAQRSRGWKLAERQQEEHSALHTVLDALAHILSALEAVRPAFEERAVEEAAAAIENNVSALDEAFVVVRHAAFDLLLWTRRSGQLEDSPLPDRYRGAYRKLIAYSPIFRPWLEALQAELLERSNAADTGGPATRLLSAVTRMNASLETARGFVRTVADPPLDLAFRETNLFLADWEALPAETRASLGSELNDTCEFLLYERGHFDDRVHSHTRPLPGDLEASLHTLGHDGHLVLFAVDEDPLFGEVIVTLYRAVPEDESEAAREQVFSHLERAMGGPGDATEPNHG